MRLDNRFLVLIILIFTYLYGWRFLSWEFEFSKLLAIFLFGLLVQTLFCLAFKIPINACLSAIITTLIIGLLLRTEFIFICGMVSFFAISSKYICQFRGKHLFNPANFGLIFLVLFTNQAFITSYRVDVLWIAILLMSSAFIIYRSHERRLDVFVFLPLTYILSRGVVHFFSLNVAPIPLDQLWFWIYSGILLMDPLSNPNSRVGRILWVIIIVSSSLILEHKFQIANPYFFALGIGGLFMPLIDYVFNIESRFSWDSVKRRLLHTNDNTSITA